MAFGTSVHKTIAVTANIATTPIIRVDNFAVGAIDVPAGSTITSITFYGSNDGTNFYLLYEGGADLAALAVVASRSTRIPDEVLGRPWLKMLGNAAGNVVLNLAY